MSLLHWVHVNSLHVFDILNLMSVAMFMDAYGRVGGTGWGFSNFHDRDQREILLSRPSGNNDHMIM